MSRGNNGANPPSRGEKDFPLPQHQQAVRPLCAARSYGRTHRWSAQPPALHHGRPRWPLFSQKDAGGVLRTGSRNRSRNCIAVPRYSLPLGVPVPATASVVPPCLVRTSEEKRNPPGLLAGSTPFLRKDQSQRLKSCDLNYSSVKVGSIFVKNQKPPFGDALKLSLTKFYILIQYQ